MKHSIRLCMLGLAAAIASSFAWAEATPSTALLVLSKQDHTLAIVDPADLHVVARIPVGDDPHEVIASADGNTAYVSNYGFGAFHTITVIDLITQKPLAPIDLGALRGPHGLTFENGKLWFTAEAAKAIGSYDPATGKIDWIMGTGQNRTHMLYVFPDAPAHPDHQRELRNRDDFGKDRGPRRRTAARIADWAPTGRGRRQGPAGPPRLRAATGN